jgi:ankyrin repeat protein
MRSVMTGSDAPLQGRRPHRALLATGVGLFGLSFSCGMGGVLLWPLVALYIVASLATAIGMWSDEEAERTRADALTAAVSLTLTALVLGALLGLWFSWPVYFAIAGVLLLESLVLAPPWRWRGLGQAALLVAALVAAPIAVATRGPGSGFDSVRAHAFQHLRLLLALGADPNARYGGEPILDFAVSVGDFRIVRLLLEQGADPNGRSDSGPHNGTPVLLTAAGESSLPVLRALIEAGADLERRNDSGWTALFRAARQGLPDNLKALLDAGADVHARDSEGATALFVANSRRIAELLLDHGADPHAADLRGRTALLAHVTSDSAIVELLIERGLDVNARDLEGRTALVELIDHSASPAWYEPQSRGFVQAQLLVAAGADLRRRDAEGLTPAERATRRNLSSLARLLEPGSSPAR